MVAIAANRTISSALYLYPIYQIAPPGQEMETADRVRQILSTKGLTLYRVSQVLPRFSVAPRPISYPNTSTSTLPPKA